MDDLTPEELAKVGLIDVDQNTLRSESYRPDAPMARSAKVQERRTMVLNLRKKGVPSDPIARIIREQNLASQNYGPKEVSKDFSDAIKVYQSQGREAVRDLQTLENLRLDFMWSRLDAQIASGSPSAILAGAAVIRLRIGLYGLNEDFQTSVDEQVKCELSGVLDLLQSELSGEAYNDVLMAISGRNKVDVSDRIETVEIDSEEAS